MLAQPEGAFDYEEQLMAGLVPKDSDNPTSLPIYIENLHYLLGRVDLNLLKPENKALVQCMQLFSEETQNKGPLDERSLMDMLIAERVPAEKQVKYTELLAHYSNTQSSPAKFRYAISRWLKQKEEEAFTKALNEAFTIQTSGMKVGRDQLKGYRDAKQFLQQRMFEIESRYAQSNTPEGDVRQEALLVVEQYKDRKVDPGKFVGLLSGVAPIDELTNGAQPGELIVIGGYTEVGKSFMTMNWGYNCSMVQARNIVIGTAEVVYDQYRRRIALRHARNANFGLPQGIDSDSFKKGKLTLQEEQAFEQAMRDFTTNPSYGRIYLFQIPKGATLPWIANKLSAINSMWADIGGVHGFFLDSLNLIAPTMKGEQHRVALNDTIKATKELAVTFDKGRGIPIVSPWHANRKAWEEAAKNGFYTLASWAEADWLERSADFLMWLLKLPSAQDSHEIMAGIDKYRDGKGHVRFTLYEDFASSYLGTVATGVPLSGIPSQTPQNASNAPGQTIGQFDNRVQGLF